MKLTKKTATWSSRDQFMAIKSEALSAFVGKEITVLAAAVGEDVSSETGEIMDVGYLRVEMDGDTIVMLSTVSKTAIQQIDALIDMKEDNLKLIICEQQCKKDAKQAFVYFDFA